MGALLGNVDVPRMLEGGMGAQFFGLVALPAIDHDWHATCHTQIDLLEQAAAASGGKLRLARTARDAEEAAREGAIAGFLGLEGAHALQGRMARLDHFASRGVRYLGLLHFSANECGAPALGLGRDDGQGLTQFGRNVIERCEELRVVVDLAHINRKGFMQACEMAERPLFVTHTGVSGVHPLWRNIDDEQLREVARLGGAVGVIFCPRFLGRDGVEGVVEHILHIAKVAGEDTPALGSDWDGFIVPSRGLEEANKLPSLTDALLAAGLSQTAVSKVLRGNAMRVLREVAP